MQTQQKFNGSDYIPKRDDERLSKAQDRIFNLMKDGQFRDLPTIARLCGSSESSASAILRHFRKERFGSHTINKEYRGNGVFVYQLVVNSGEPVQMKLF